MKKLKHIITITLALLITNLTFGQPPKRKGPNKEKLKVMKVSYLTEKMDLTAKEAQQFWPIYNEFDKKMEENHTAMRKIHKNKVAIDDMSDAEVEKMINTIDGLRQKDLDIHKEYHTKFKAILPIKKVAKLYKADQDFKRDLLKKIKNHKGMRPGNEGPPPGGRR